MVLELEHVKYLVGKLCGLYQIHIWKKRKYDTMVHVKTYRPGQPNWEYTMWKYKDFSATHILHEINYSHFEAPKTAVLTISAALNFV